MHEVFPEEGNGPYRLLRAFSEPAIRALQRGCEDPEDTQRERLRAILAGARGTAFAAEHGLDGVHDLADFRRSVPIRTYDGLRGWFDRVAAGEQRVLTREKVRQLLKTSGTTGASKLLPVTRAYEREVSEGQALWRLALVRDHEAVARGKALSVISPGVEGRTPAGVPFGSNTGRMYSRQPWVVRLRYPAPPAVFAIDDARARLYTLLRFALQAPITSITTANPSTVLRICRSLMAWQEDLAGDMTDGTLRRGPAAALSPKLRRTLERRLKRRAPPTDWRPASIWELAVINCWKGGPAPFFLEKLPEALGADLPVRDVGVTASEGYFAIPLDDGDGSGLAWLGGHVLEFVDDGGEVRWAWELEEGEQYRLVITTSAGLYRYDLDDIVEVTGHRGRAPLLRFVRKGANILSVTGEKVSEEQVVVAARRALSGLSVVGFTAAHLLEEVPRIQLGVEGLPAGDLEALGRAFDVALREGNVEYDSKRGTERLGEAVVVRLADGAYRRFREARVAAGAPDAQVKDPVVAVKAATWELLKG